MRTNIRVNGMNCEHCVQAVTTSLTAMPGVDGVSVDLAASLVTVDSAQPVPVEALSAAVDDAGFEFAGVMEPTA